ncbi:MAG: hypothetical protein V1738_01835 [Patescibacteria group bacterium]
MSEQIIDEKDEPLLIEDIEHAHPEVKLVEDLDHAHPEVEALNEPEEEK